jgi:hypothetical protein
MQQSQDEVRKLGVALGLPHPGAAARNGTVEATRRLGRKRWKK